VESRNQGRDESDRVQPPGDAEPREQTPGRTRDIREANENIRKAQGDDAMDTPVDPKRTGNKPRFDRDR
jgi:hypothetical protein